MTGTAATYHMVGTLEDGPTSRHREIAAICAHLGFTVSPRAVQIVEEAILTEHECRMTGYRYRKPPEVVKLGQKRDKAERGGVACSASAG